MISEVLSPIKNEIRDIDSCVDVLVSKFPGYLHCQCNGRDPQFEILTIRPLRPGWYEFQYRAEVTRGELTLPKLYVDDGNGYSETNAVRIPASKGTVVRAWMYFSKKLEHLRFDPTEDQDAEFDLHEVCLRTVSRYEIWKRMSRIPNGSLKNTFVACLDAAGKVLKNDVPEIQGRLSGLNRKKDPFGYQNWIQQYDSYTKADWQRMEKQQSAFAYRPLISLVIPTFNSRIDWLEECLDSVQRQVYDHWEVCIADDCSTQEQVRDFIRDYAAKYPKVNVVFNNRHQHIAATSNAALAVCSGEFVCFLDQDDTLHPLSLYRIVTALNDDRDIDFFYSDEDKIDEEGRRVDPFFKPGWSPSLLLIQNYITHLACIRRDLISAAGGFSTGLEGSQDYDLFLKVALKTTRIRHLPYILYHWRKHMDSASLNGNVKSYADEAGKKALEKYLANKYPEQFSHIESGGHRFIYKPRFHFSREYAISIIIPTRDKVEYLEPCINSILSKSTWNNFEIIIVNNNSTDEKTFHYFEWVQKENAHVKVVDALFDFNWSRLNNEAAKHATGDFLIFLNNDISVITPDWMEQMGEWAGLPDVATVGALLLYPDQTIQHAGIIVGLNGWADHVYKSLEPVYFSSPFVSNNIPRNVIANTGACMAIERKKFEALGGFDESFIVCGSDVELGIRAHKRGLLNVYNGFVQLFHYESKSRGATVPENDFVESAIKYEPYRTLQTDPFYNPNLSLTHISPVCKQ